MKEADYKLSEIGSFLGGTISSIALLWVIYGQTYQTKLIENQSKIYEHEIKSLSPYLTVSILHEKFEYYKDKNDFFNSTRIKFKPNQTLESFKEEQEIIKKFYEINKDLVPPIQFRDENIKSKKIDIYNLINSPFYQKKLLETFENSKLKNGSQVLNIKIKNIGKPFDILSIENTDLFIDNSSDTEFKETNKIITVTYRIPINYFWEIEKGIGFILKGRDLNSDLRAYRINITLNDEARKIVNQEKSFITENFRFEEKLSHSRMNVQDLVAEVSEIKFEY